MNSKIQWQQPNESAGPLSRMRVLDLSQQLPGPYTSELLGALGADVIKIEPPGGDAARHLDPTMFERVNVHKRMVTLDLKDTSHREELYRLIPEADVFLEGFRPGVTARLGCDYEAVKAQQPNIVYCAISGFGQEGPLAKRPTHDVSLQALIGALPPDRLQNRIGVPWVDLGTGSTAAFLITAAWQAGRGEFIDLAMLDTALSWARVKPEAVADIEPTYGTLRSADRELVVIALLEDAMWDRLCQALQWDDWQHEPSMKHYRDRRAVAGVIRERLECTVARLSSAELHKLALDFDLPIEVIVPNSSELAAQLEARTGNADELFHLPIPDNMIEVGEPKARSGGDQDNDGSA